MMFPHADIVMSDVAVQTRLDNEMTSVYGTLDENFKADPPTLISAHLNAFAWGLTNVLQNPSSEIDAEYLASLIQERCLQAVRQVIADLEEGDLYA